MGTGNDVGDDLSLLRVRNTRLQNAYDGGRTRIPGGAKSNSLADNGRIAVQCCRPETICQDDGSRGVRAVIVCIEQAAKRGPQPHGLEIGSADDSRPNGTRLSEADKCESN